jgi:hypothetical protein
MVPSAGQKILVQPGWYLPPRRSRLLKTCFFRQVRRELKIQTKNPGSALCVGYKSRNLRHRTWDKVRCYCEHVRGTTHWEVEKHVRNPMGI